MFMERAGGDKGARYICVCVSIWPMGGTAGKIDGNAGEKVG